MKVHVIALAKDTGIRPEHVIAAGLEVGYTSIEEALEAVSELRMGEAEASALREVLEQKQHEAHLAAQDMLKQELAAITTWEQLHVFGRAHRLVLYSSDELKRLFVAKEIEVADTRDRISGIHWPEHWKATDLRALKNEKYEHYALQDAKHAHGFKKVFELYAEFGNSDAPSGKLIWEKLQQVACTKEQLKQLCEYFAPYDPRNLEHPDPDAEAHKPSDKYLYFVKKLAAFYPLPGNTPA